jgi:Copper transport outer membrane protein, MctB
VIDFRYHLVSIIAVFLALAVGIVVGVEVHPLAVRALQTSENLLKQEINKVTNQGKTLQNQNNLGQTFAQAAAPRLLGGLLPGQKVVLVTTSDADSSVVSGVTTALTQAGANVTGQVQLSQSFFDTGGATRQLLIQLADRLAPQVGVKVSTQPAIPQIAGQEAAAQVIAAGIVGKALAVPTAAQAQTVLSGFSQANFLQVIGGSAAFQPGTMAVVVIPSSPVTPANDADPSIQGLLAVAQQLAHDSEGMVIAGNLSGAGPGSAIDAVVSNGDPLSTVDNADSETGQIIVVQALAKLLEGHKPQSYGVLVGNVPSPVPVPTPSVSTSAPPARKPK